MNPSRLSACTTGLKIRIAAASGPPCTCTTEAPASSGRPVGGRGVDEARHPLAVRGRHPVGRRRRRAGRAARRACPRARRRRRVGRAGRRVDAVDRARGRSGAVTRDDERAIRRPPTRRSSARSAGSVDGRSASSPSASWTARADRAVVEGADDHRRCRPARPRADRSCSASSTRRRTSSRRAPAARTAVNSRSWLDDQQHGVVVGAPGDVLVGGRLVRVGQRAAARGTGHRDRHRVGQQAEPVDHGRACRRATRPSRRRSRPRRRPPAPRRWPGRAPPRPCRRRCGGWWSRRARSRSRPGRCACAPGRATSGSRSSSAAGRPSGVARSSSDSCMCSSPPLVVLHHDRRERRAGSGRCSSDGRSVSGVRVPSGATSTSWRLPRSSVPASTRPPRRCRRPSTCGCRGARAPGPGGRSVIART